MKTSYLGLLFVGYFIACATGCGDDGGSEADNLGVGSMCEEDSNCPVVMIEEVETQLLCLTQFGGGYCAIEGCSSGAECPEGSLCVAHDDGKNYCFLACKEKTECNRNRHVDYESNCSANFDFVEPDDDEGEKACIPPSSGDGG